MDIEGGLEHRFTVRRPKYPADSASFGHQGRLDLSPVLAVVAGHVNQAVVGPDREQSRPQFRNSDRVVILP